MVLEARTMNDLKQARNEELIDKAISYLKELRDNDDIQSVLEVRVVADESSMQQDFEVFVSIDLEKAINQ